MEERRRFTLNSIWRIAGPMLLRSVAFILVAPFVGGITYLAITIASVAIASTDTAPESTLLGYIAHFSVYSV